MSAVQSAEVLFNDGWEFAEKEIDDSLMKKENGDARILSPEGFLQDAAVLRYSPVLIPHDWLITDTNNLYRNSIGFYRKEFELGCTADTYTAVKFDGVYMNCAVFVNGRSAGIWKYGYTSFEIDLSPFVHDGRNSILVIAVYQSPNSRWYSGAGIYRNVHLCVKGKTRFVNNGIYIVSKKESSDAWRLSVSADIAGCTDGCSVRHLLCDMAGNVIAEATGEPDFAGQPGDGGVFRNSASFTVLSPELWDTAHPAMYSLTTELVSVNGDVIDSVCQHTGFRTIVTDPDKGLFLNGRHIKINGVCMHHDLGLFGAAFNVHALERQFFKLKKMGVNSIRTAHNPPAPEFMDLADTMGFLIDDEAFDMWQKPKTTYDYSTFFDAWYERDTESWIKRDRNHPCLFMWSIGNEIYDTHFGNGLEVTKKLKVLVRLYDPEKNGLVTIGSNYMAGEGAQICADELDLAGYNYGERLYAEHHKKHPSRCMYGSETSSTVQSRGIYHFPASYRLLTCEDRQCSSLGNCSSNWGAVSVTQALLNERDTPWSMGQYVWSGWDYIGEPTPYFTKNSYFGQIDTAGFEKDTYWLFKAEWTDYHTDPFVHLLPYWDFNEGQLIDIRMYTNAPVAELFFNGIPQGKFCIDHKNGRELSGAWQLPYMPGVIKAAAYDEKGNVIAEEIVRTPGEPSPIVLEQEHCGETGNICFIDISTADTCGNPVPDARNCITVEVRGGATLCGLDNGDSTDYDRYQPGDGRTHTRRLFSNRLLAVVRADTPSSEFSVTAVSRNLRPAELSGTVASLVPVQPEQGTIPASGETPVRKIELTTSGSCMLSKERKSVTVKARIYPADASYMQLEWRAVRIEGIRSEYAEIAVQGDTAVVTAAADGNFRLRCTCSNGRQEPEVMSDLEFTVSGMGNRNLDPYRLIEACRYDSCLVKPALSFLGGVYTLEGRNWFLFTNVDFGCNGADTVTIPVFSFDTELPLAVWDGCPDEGGRKIASCTYKAPGIYNAYTANTFVLPERLNGIHSIAVETETRLSLQGFFFKKTEKAFAQLWAGACETITGDSFTRTSEVVTGIGNNVSFVYTCMDFGTAGTDCVTICGRTHFENNTITLKFAGDPETENRIVEFPFSSGYEEKKFAIDTVCGLRTVSFMFLPGSSFDFKWFRFEKKKS
jgi:beta-galactosidase